MTPLAVSKTLTTDSGLDRIVLNARPTDVQARPIPRSKSKTSAFVSDFRDLAVGDYVVHEDHGIALFSGIETRTVAGVTRDYLFLHPDRTKTLTTETQRH